MIDGLNSDTEYELQIREFGNLTDDCANAGDVFNPMAPEPQPKYVQDYWGRWIQDGYEEPEEIEGTGPGEIDIVTSSAEGTVDASQDELEQNLAGKQSLIGRSIVLVEKDDDVPLGCCVIGRDVYRMSAPEPEGPKDD